MDPDRRPEEPWPPPFPSESIQADLARTRYSQPSPSVVGVAERAWLIAGLSGVVTLAGLLVVHLSRESEESAMFRAGFVLPTAVVSTVVVALLLGGTGTSPRRWPWWLIAFTIPLVAAFWYLAVAVAPDLREDALAEERAEDDASGVVGPAYVLHLPPNIADWRLIEGPGADARREEALERFEGAPEEFQRNVEVLVGEYALGRGARIYFTGLNIGSEMRLDQESTDSALRNFMAGSGATSATEVPAGDLGGSMACTVDVPKLPYGYVFCAWADYATLGQVSVEVDETGPMANADLRAAGAVALKLREGVTRR